MNQKQKREKREWTPNLVLKKEEKAENPKLNETVATRKGNKRREGSAIASVFTGQSDL